jgi:hypothetical protein
MKRSATCDDLEHAASKLAKFEAVAVDFDSDSDSDSDNGTNDTDVEYISSYNSYEQAKLLGTDKMLSSGSKEEFVNPKH